MKYIIVLPDIDEHEDPELFNELVKFSNSVDNDGRLLYITETLSCPFCKVQFQTTVDFLCHMEAFGFDETKHMAKWKRYHRNIEQ